MKPIAEDNQETLQHKYAAEQFSKRMAAALDAHRHLGQWTQWHPDKEEMGRRVFDNEEQLQDALNAMGPDEIIRHAINLANICMKIVEVYEMPVTTRPSDAPPQSSKAG